MAEKSKQTADFKVIVGSTFLSRTSWVESVPRARVYCMVRGMLLEVTGSVFFYSNIHGKSGSRLAHSKGSVCEFPPSLSTWCLDYTIIKALGIRPGIQ